MKEIDKLIQGKKWKEICNKVFNRQKGICQKCGIQLRKLSGNTQVDHIIPRRFWDEPEKSKEGFATLNKLFKNIFVPIIKNSIDLNRKCGDERVLLHALD